MAISRKPYEYMGFGGGVQKDPKMTKNRQKGSRTSLPLLCRIFFINSLFFLIIETNNNIFLYKHLFTRKNKFYYKFFIKNIKNTKNTKKMQKNGPPGPPEPLGPPPGPQKGSKIGFLGTPRPDLTPRRAR